MIVEIIILSLQVLSHRGVFDFIMHRNKLNWSIMEDILKNCHDFSTDLKLCDLEDCT